MELRVQTLEVAQREDDHFFGVGVHPLLYLCENSLSRTQEGGCESYFSCEVEHYTGVFCMLDLLRHL